MNGRRVERVPGVRGGWRPGGRAARAVMALGTVLGALALALLPGAPAPASDKPSVRLSVPGAGPGAHVTVTGAGWRPGALLMLLICGRAEPGRGATDACANSEGRAVTTDEDGAFRRKLPVAEPPEPCPCVVRVATVTGEKAGTETAFRVAGHPVKPLSPPGGDGRLTVLTGARLDGSDGLLTWFGAPPRRTLAFTVGNVGAEPVKDPVFQLGSSHGVFAPGWEEQQWRGTVAPGGRARIELPVELAAGAHGDYLVSVKLDGRILAEEPWDVGRPWGVTVFWLMLVVVVPAAVFRAALTALTHLRPRDPPGRHRTPRRP